MKTYRNEAAEQGFKKRYNRVIICEQGREINPDKTIKQTQTIITSDKGKKYIINEYLDNNLTKSAHVMDGDYLRIFQSYLLAEVYVADEIGKES